MYIYISLHPRTVKFLLADGYTLLCPGKECMPPFHELYFHLKISAIPPAVNK